MNNPVTGATKIEVLHTRSGDIDYKPGIHVYENVTSLYYSRRYTFELPREEAEKLFGCDVCELRKQSGRRKHFLSISLRKTKASRKTPAELVALCQIKIDSNAKPKTAHCAMCFARTTHLPKELPLANQPEE